MKARRHHNNKGQHAVRTGKTRDQVERMARRLGVPYGGPNDLTGQRPGNR